MARTTVGVRWRIFRIICFFALAALTGAAFQAASRRPAAAAEFPVKARPYAARLADPFSSWSGCYAGGNFGYGGASDDWYDPQVAANEGGHTASGLLVGAQGGCDHQIGRVVVGLQGLFDGTSLDGQHAYTDDPNYTDRTRLSWLATLTGRIGFVIQPVTLIYLKGGAAWVGDKFTEVCSTSYDPSCPGAATATRSGWTIGGGLEYRLHANWSAFIEYNYLDFGRRTATLVYSDGSTWDYGIKQTAQNVLIGMNYRFGYPPFGDRD